MTKIDKVSIRNLKILKNIDLELSNLTLITGINSTGKSTFIQSLLLLKQNQEMLTRLNNYKFMQKSMSETDDISKYMQDIFEKSKKEPLALNGNYIELGNIKDILSELIYDEDIKIELEIDNMTYSITCDSNDLSVNIESSFPIEAIINLFSENFQYINTDRIQPQDTYLLSDINIRKNLIGFNGEYTAHYLDENRHKKLNLIALKHEHSKTEQLLENISLWLNEISNGIEVLVKKYPSIKKVGLSYKYTYGDNTTNELNPLNVGFGLTYVLPVIVAILKAKPNDLVIIENPESHLHPAGQSKVAELCAIASANGVQIIIETHSDHFLNRIRIATKKGILTPKQSKVYYFRKDKDELETKIDEINIDTEGGIDSYPKGFFDQFDDDLDELLGL
jgi:predicted ATPase